MVISDYLKRSPKVRIPDTLEGEPVVRVDFSKLEKEVTNLILPDSAKDFDLYDKIKAVMQYYKYPRQFDRDWRCCFLRLRKPYKRNL